MVECIADTRPIASDYTTVLTTVQTDYVVNCQPRFRVQGSPKKVSCTFVITTLENTLDFYNFCISVSRKKRFTHS